MPDQSGYTFLDPNFQKELDDLQRMYLENERNKLRAVVPQETPAPPSEPFSEKLKRYGYRAGEVLGEFGHTALQLPATIAKLPANLEQEYLGKTGPIFGRLREGARWLEGKSAGALETMRQGVREHGGVPLQEKTYDTGVPLLGEVSAATPSRFIGTVAAPAPGLPAIPKLLSKAAIKPALEGIGKLGAYGAGLSAAQELDKPAEERDWWNVPKSAAIGLTAPPLQRLMGIGRGGKVPPAPGATGGAGGGPGKGGPGGGDAFVTEPTTGTRLPATLNLEEELPLDLIGKPETFQPLEPGPTPTLTHTPGAMPQQLLPNEADTFLQSKPLHGRPQPTVPQFMGAPKDFRSLENLPPAEPVGGAGATRMFGQDVELRRPQDIVGEDLTGGPGATTMFGQKVPLQPIREMPLPETALSPGIAKPEIAAPIAEKPLGAPEVPFTLTHQTREIPRGGPSKPEQMGIDVPPETIGTRPIIGREVEQGSADAPLFSKAAQAPAAQQMGIPETPAGLRPVPEARVSPGARILKDFFDQQKPDGPVTPEEQAVLQGLADRYNKFTKQGIEPATVHEMLAQTTTPAEMAVIRRHLEPVKPEPIAIPAEPSPVNIHGEEMALRAEKALADMEIAGTERGSRSFTETVGMGSEQEVTGLKSATAAWYKELSKGAGKLPKQRIERAIQNILNNRPGKTATEITDLARVKDVLSRDQEFHQSPWGRPIDSTPIEHPESFPPAVVNPKVDSVAQVRAKGETGVLKDALDGVKGLLKDERGSTQLGKDLGPVERWFVLPQHLAESHPEFKPTYEALGAKESTFHTFKHETRQVGKDYLSLPEAEKRAVNDLLLKRREMQANVPIPQKWQAAVTSHDAMMKQIMDWENTILTRKGLQPHPVEPYYTPLARTGDIITIMDSAKGTPKYVAASQTLREGEAIERQLQAMYPGAKTRTIQRTRSKGDEPPMSPEVISRLVKSGYLTPQEYIQVMKEYGIPPGHMQHFMKAARTSGASNDPAMIERYIDSSSEYMAKMLHDEKIYDAIGKMGKSRVQDYARELFQYTREKPEEYSRIRSSASKFALGLNVGSILMNKTQPITIGLPILQRELGGSLSEARATMKWAREMAKNPGPQEQALIDLMDKRGVLRDANTQELFGQGTIEQSGVELGARGLQRRLEGGTRFPGVIKTLRTAADAGSNLIEKGYEGMQRLDLKLGKSVGMDLPLTMGMYSKVEKDNRLISMLAGYKAGLSKGLAGDPLLRYAEGISEAINFNYGHINRPPAFRGKGAPLGLFTVYPTAAITLHKRMYGEAFTNLIQGNIKKMGPAASLAGMYWALAGAKGYPGVDLLNKTGLGPFEPGFLHDPSGDSWADFAGDLAYYGPASVLTGLNIGSRASVTPSLPVDPATGEFMPSNFAAIRPVAGVVKGVKRFAEDPSAGTFYKGLEDMAPPALAAPLTAARWSMGGVGTKYEHPYLDAEGKPAFYEPNIPTLAAKAMGFNPIELQKMRDRSELASLEFKKFKDETGPMRGEVTRHLERNGLTIGSEKMREFAAKHPDSYANTMKAYNQWVAAGKKGSVEQYYQMIAAKAQSKSLENARKKHP